MRFIALIFALLVSCSAFAQVPMTGAGLGAPTGGGGYTGPGDVVAGAIAWWGLRAYSAAKAGNAAINLCDNAGANCSDIATNASTGKLNAGGTHGSNNCDTSGTCVIAILYDQTAGTNCAGSCNMTTATNAARPLFTPNCLGSLPCMTCPGTVTGFNTGGNNMAQAQPYTISGYAKRTGNTSAFGDVLGISASVQFLFNSAVNQFTIYSGTVATAQTANDNVFHAMQGIYSGAASAIYLDGAASGAISAGASAISGPPEMCNGNNALTGNVTEIGVWAIAFNGTQQGNINNNQTSFW